MVAGHLVGRRRGENVAAVLGAWRIGGDEKGCRQRGRDRRGDSKTGWGEEHRGDVAPWLPILRFRGIGMAGYWREFDQISDLTWSGFAELDSQTRPGGHRLSVVDEGAQCFSFGSRLLSHRFPVRHPDGGRWEVTELAEAKNPRPRTRMRCLGDGIYGAGRPQRSHSL